MNKRHGILGLILLSAGISASACSSDGDDTSPGSGGSAGKAGSSGSAGAATGSAGESEGGAGPTGPSALNPRSVLVTRAAPVTDNHLLVAGTDFTSNTEVVSVTLAPAAVGGGHTYADGDAVPASSAGLGFVLERTNDKVDLLDGGAIKTTFDITQTGDGSTVDLANKAYVGLYNKSLISVLDLAAGKVSGRIDLTEFNAASDSDGSAEITSAVYDADKKIAYFTLGRIDLNAIAADPNFHLPCSTTTSLVVGIDATTDTVLDLNGAAAGKALELTLVYPTTLAISADGSALTVLADGCYDGATLKNQGVEVVDLTTGTSQVAYAPTGTDFLSNLILLDGTAALLNTDDANFTSHHWFKLDLGTGTLGAELMNVPDSPSYDGTDLLGVDITGMVGSVVRYTIATDSTTPVTPTSWSGQYSSASGTALVE
jgi:hypothetical protein